MAVLATAARSIAQSVIQWFKYVWLRGTMLVNGETDIIFDRFGAPKLRILESGWIVTFQGQYLGLVTDDTVYNVSGRHVGWYEGGVLRDLHGSTAGFGVNPTDTPTPFLPFRQFVPFRGFVGSPPYPSYPEWPSFKPIKNYGWSPLPPIALFGSK